MALAFFEERTEGVSLGGVIQTQSQVQGLGRVRGTAMRFSYGHADTRMNRLPDRQIDVDDAPRLGRIRRPRNGHVKTFTAQMGGDEANLPQKLLQVAGKAWSIDDDVQAAVTLRSCRNGVAFPLSLSSENRRRQGAAKQSVHRGHPLTRTGNRGLCLRHVLLVDRAHGIDLIEDPDPRIERLEGRMA